MVKWITKNTTEYRLETIEDVKQFEQEQRDRANENGYTLQNFSYTLKEKKAKGEVLEEWYICKVTCVLNDPKEPETPWGDIEFKLPETNAF